MTRAPAGARASLPALLAVLSGLAASGGASAAPLPRNLMVGGVERHYLLVVPSAYDGKAPVPVVFVFHG